MSKGPPLLVPLGITKFKPKKPAQPQVRPPKADEAKVAIIKPDGTPLQEKLGLLSRGGTVCHVRYEGEYQQAQLVDGRWVYVLRPRTGDEP